MTNKIVRLVNLCINHLTYLLLKSLAQMTRIKELFNQSDEMEKIASVCVI